MKKIISLLLSLTMLIGALSILTACGDDEDLGAQISVYLGEEVYDFDPTEYYVDKNAEQLMSLLFEPLFKVNERGKIKCAAADDYEIDEDERTITVTLRESYWSDESLVIANHFIEAWKRLLSPNTANPAAALLYDIEGAYEMKMGTLENEGDLGIERTEINVITITYREEADPERLLANLANVATSPIHYDYYEQAPEYWTKGLNSLVTNGPFMLNLNDFETGEFTVERNPGYHQALDAKRIDKEVRPHKLISHFGIGDEAVKFIVDGELVELDYEDIEEKTVFYMSDASLDDRKDYKKEVEELVDDLSTYTYVFNTTDPRFAIKEVRQALSLAIDRNAIIDAVTFGKAATGFIPEAAIDPDTGKSYETDTAISENLDRAKQLLASVSGQITNNKITIKVNNDEESVAIANLVKAQWEATGYFTVEVVALDAVMTEFADGSTYYDSAIQRLVKNAAANGVYDFDVIAVDWQMYSTDPFVALAAFSKTMGVYGFNYVDGTNAIGAPKLNISAWQNDAYDTLIKEAYLTDDNEVRSDKLHAAEQILLDEMPVIPIMFNQNFAFTARGLSKLEVSGFGDFILTDLKQRKYKKYLPEEE